MAIQSHLTNGLIEADESEGEGVYNATARGVAHIYQLCETPFPVQQWVDRNGKVIEF